MSILQSGDGMDVKMRWKVGQVKGMTRLWQPKAMALPL